MSLNVRKHQEAAEEDESVCRSREGAYQPITARVDRIHVTCKTPETPQPLQSRIPPATSPFVVHQTLESTHSQLDHSHIVYDASYVITGLLLWPHNPFRACMTRCTTCTEGPGSLVRDSEACHSRPKAQNSKVWNCFHRRIAYRKIWSPRTLRPTARV